MVFRLLQALPRLMPRPTMLASIASRSQLHFQATRAELSPPPLAVCTRSCSSAIQHFLDPYELDPDLPPPGRKWRAKEMRLKSDYDLQRLWIVLLKEKNMLTSVKHMHKRRGTEMPHKVRLSNVCKSMAILKTVLSERRIAIAKKRAEDGIESFPSRRYKAMLKRKAQKQEALAEGGRDVTAEAKPQTESTAS